jgi:N-acetyl-anhydromuramyl-L-alanine amidase AmpD
VEAMKARFKGWPLHHWLVYQTGEIVNTAAPSQLLYHVGSRNFSSLSVAVVGDYTQTEPPDRLFSALDDLLRYIWMEFPHVEDLAAHSEIDPLYPHCPGGSFTSWVASLRQGRGVSRARTIERVGARS